jgi:sensor histidine kinase YesM
MKNEVTIFLKRLYKKHPYFFNLLVILVLVQVFRTLDWLFWSPEIRNHLSNLFLDRLFESISLLPVMVLLIYSYNWALKKKSRLLLYILVFVFIIFGPCLFICMTTWMELAFLSGREVVPLSLKLILRMSPMGSMVLLLFSATFLITHLVAQSEIQRETAYKAETLAKDVQLKMLRYQINPHFLFNVLNSIYTLIDENTEKARKLVLDMSEYYRYTLNKQQHTITIEKEVESILKYLEIQKTRFEDEFHYEISVDDPVKPLLIPSFLIHLLVENAVKYGTKSARQKLIIRITIVMVNRNLIMKVSNTGKLVNSDSDWERQARGTGNGLENLKFRLALYYKDNYTFSLNEENGWVHATIEINNIAR